MDFKTKSTQGFGEDWPLTYEELAPYYDRVERLVGIVGNRDNYINMPDGIYCGPPHAPRCSELYVKERAAKIGVPVLNERTAVLSVKYDGRPKCHYCGECGRGCDVRARFSTVDGIIPKLAKKPNFTLRTNAVAYQVTTDSSGKATGVSFLDALSRKEESVKAKVVVLAASTAESGRILLNSKSRIHANGLGNSSGVLGHYIMDSMKAGGVNAVLPVMRNRDWRNEDGAGGSHMTIPRFNYNRKNNYYGGYFLLGGSGFSSGPAGMNSITGWGLDLKKQLRSNYGASMSLRGYGERLPEYSNYFEIDPVNKDKYGIPQLRFRVKPSDNDKKMAEDMYGWIEEIFRACGAEVFPCEKGIEPMGDATHEAGAARMGTDVKTSFLNPYCQSHYVKNLFVTDASCFVSMPGTHGITTLIMALAWRASDYLADKFGKGELA